MKHISKHQKSQVALLSFIVLFATTSLFTMAWYHPRLERAIESQWPGNEDSIPAMQIMPTLWTMTVLTLLAVFAAVFMAYQSLSADLGNHVNLVRGLGFLVAVVGVLWAGRIALKVWLITGQMQSSSGTFLYAEGGRFHIIYDLLAISLATLILASSYAKWFDPPTLGNSGLLSLLSALTALLLCFIANPKSHLYTASLAILLSAGLLLAHHRCDVNVDNKEIIA